MNLGSMPLSQEILVVWQGFHLSEAGWSVILSIFMGVALL